MRRALARRLVWGLPVWWEAGDELPALTATAETVPPVPPVTATRSLVIRHLHLTPGGDAAGLGLALSPGNAVTTEEEN